MGPRLRFLALLVSLFAFATTVSCSTEPTFVDDKDGGAHGGSGASTGSGGTGGDAGAPETCVVAGDCPGSDTECAVRTCTSGYCGKLLKPMGTVIGAQVSGDCKRVECDGKGNMVPQNDDTDLPNDANDCTADSCSAGMPMHANVAQGTACGATKSLVCDAGGVCTGCTQGYECGQAVDCVTFTCTNSTCATAFVPDGQGTPAGQTPNDCKKVVCNGAGGTRVVNDDTDPLPDGNLCTVDLCSNGVPTYQSVTPSDDGNPCTVESCDPSTGQTVHSPGNDNASCGGCSVCQSGNCVSTCGGCTYCNGSSCVSGCGACETCNGSSCQSTCGGCQVCSGGTCVGGCGPCEVCNGSSCQSQCNACQVCDAGSNTCADACGACESCGTDGACHSTCGACETCQNGACASACGACETCDTASNTCVSNCAPCQTCVSGFCQDNCGACGYCDGTYCQYDPCCIDPYCCGGPCPI